MAGWIKVWFPQAVAVIFKAKNPGKPIPISDSDSDSDSDFKAIATYEALIINNKLSESYHYDAMHNADGCFLRAE